MYGTLLLFEMPLNYVAVDRAYAGRQCFGEAAHRSNTSQSPPRTLQCAVGAITGWPPGRVYMLSGSHRPRGAFSSLSNIRIGM